MLETMILKRNEILNNNKGKKCKRMTGVTHSYDMFQSEGGDIREFYYLLDDTDDKYELGMGEDEIKLIKNQAEGRKETVRLSARGKPIDK